VAEKLPEWRQYRDFEPNEFILVAADPAAGGGDYCAVQFISKDKIDVPLVYHSNKMASFMTNELLPVLERIHDITGVRPVVAYERANGGAFEAERLALLNRAGKFDVFKMPTMGVDHSARKEGEPPPVKYGWDTNSATRPHMLGQLKDAIDNKLLTVYDVPTIEEMYSFVVTRTSNAWKAQAETGAHDDLIMALAIGWQLYQMCEKPQMHWAHQGRRPEIADHDIGI